MTDIIKPYIDKPKIRELIYKSNKHYCPPGVGKGSCVKLAAIANLPSRFGHFQVAAFYHDIDDKEHAAFIRGNVCNKKRTFKASFRMLNR